MSSYDPIKLGWQMPCPRGQQLVRLESFRSIAPLPGTSAPSVFEIHYYCKLCQALHTGLIAQDSLDLCFLDPLPVFYDLMTSRADFEADLVREKWVHKIASGSWPLSFWCSERHAVKPSWPSRIRVIEPDLEASPRAYLVTHYCLSCEEPEILETPPSALSLKPF